MFLTYRHRSQSRAKLARGYHHAWSDSNLGSLGVSRDVACSVNPSPLVCGGWSCARESSPPDSGTFRAGITFFLKIILESVFLENAFLRKCNFLRKWTHFLRKRFWEIFFPRSGTVTALSRRTCVRSFFFVATLSRDVH